MPSSPSRLPRYSCQLETAQKSHPTGWQFDKILSRDNGTSRTLYKCAFCAMKPSRALLVSVQHTSQYCIISPPGGTALLKNLRDPPLDFDQFRSRKEFASCKFFRYRPHTKQWEEFQLSVDTPLAPA